MNVWFGVSVPVVLLLGPLTAGVVVADNDVDTVELLEVRPVVDVGVIVVDTVDVVLVSLVVEVRDEEVAVVLVL